MVVIRTPDFSGGCTWGVAGVAGPAAPATPGG